MPLTPSQYINILYPKLVDPTSDRYVDPAIMDGYLEIAKEYRPKCLSEAKGNEAEAHYAASLADRSFSNIAGPQVTGNVKREKEGDVEREYFENVGTGENGPKNAWQSFRALQKLCGRGAIFNEPTVPQHPRMPNGFRP